MLSTDSKNFQLAVQSTLETANVLRVFRLVKHGRINDFIGEETITVEEKQLFDNLCTHDKVLSEFLNESKEGGTQDESLYSAVLETMSFVMDRWKWAVPESLPGKEFGDCQMLKLANSLAKCTSLISNKNMALEAETGRISLDDLQERVLKKDRALQKVLVVQKKQVSDYEKEMAELRLKRENLKAEQEKIVKEHSEFVEASQNELNGKLMKIQETSSKEIEALRNEVNNLKENYEKLQEDHLGKELMLRKKKNKVELEAQVQMKSVEEELQSAITSLEDLKQLKDKYIQETKTLSALLATVRKEKTRDSEEDCKWKKFVSEEEEKMNVYQRGAVALQKLYRGRKQRAEYQKMLQKKKKKKKGKK